MGLGVDIVKVDRISLEEGFVNFILSSKEKEIFATKGVNKQQFLAGRFAAKEAFLKANHMGLGEIPLKEIEVLYGEKGNPIIVHNNNIYEEVSISHEKEYAIATVLILWFHVHLFLQNLLI